MSKINIKQHRAWIIEIYAKLYRYRNYSKWMTFNSEKRSYIKAIRVFKDWAEKEGSDYDKKLIQDTIDIYLDIERIQWEEDQIEKRLKLM